VFRQIVSADLSTSNLLTFEQSTPDSFDIGCIRVPSSSAYQEEAAGERQPEDKK
jgi:hypothetical protein